MKKLLILMSLIPTFIFSKSWNLDTSLTYNWTNYELNVPEHKLLYNLKIGQDRKDIDLKWGFDVLIDPYTLIYFNTYDINYSATFNHNMYLNYKSKPFKYTKITVDLNTTNDKTDEMLNSHSNLFTAKIGHETTFNNKIQLYNRLHLGFEPYHTWQPNIPHGQVIIPRSISTQIGIDMGLNILINDNLKFKAYALGLYYNVGFPITENLEYIRKQILGRVGLEYKNKIFTYEPSVQYEFFAKQKQRIIAKILNFDINPNDKLNIKLKTDLIFTYQSWLAAEPKNYIIDANFDISYKYKKNKLHFEPKLELGVIADFRTSNIGKAIDIDITAAPTVNLGYEIIDNLVLFTDFTPKIIVSEYYNNYSSSFKSFKIAYDIYAKVGVKYNW